MAGYLNKLFVFLQRYHKALLVFLWLAVQIYLYQSLGIKIVYDSHRYILEGKNLAAADFDPAQSNFSYIGYIFFVALFFKLGFSVETIILAQVLLSGISAVYFYRTALQVSGSWLSATFATALFSAWFDLQCWNYYIHTESLLISLFLIYTWLLVSSSAKIRWFWLLPLLVAIVLVRPNGIIMVGATLVFVFTTQARNKAFIRRSLLALPVLAALGAWILNILLKNLKSTFGPIAHYNSGHVIGGFAGWAVPAPKIPFLPDPETSPVVQVWQYIQHYPVYFFKLALVKFLAFFAQIKPYYSLGHNLSIVVFIYPCYFFFLKGLFSKQIYLPFRLYLLTAVLLQALITAFTMLDWDNRFIAPVLPFIFLLAGIEMGLWLEQKRYGFSAEKSA